MPVQSKMEKMMNAMSVIQGVRKRFGGRKSLLLHGVKMTPAELIAKYDGQLAAMEKVRKAGIAYDLALAEERALRQPMKELTVAVKNAVRLDFGFEGYGDFGWKKPKKPGPKTVAAKLSGVEKRAAKRRRG